MKSNLWIILISVLAGQGSIAAFRQTQTRFLSGQDLISTMSKLYPGYQQINPHQIPVRCTILKTSNKDLLGISSPSLGEPIVDRPSPAMVRWLNDCISNYLKHEFPETGKYRVGLLGDYFPKSVIESYSLDDSAKLKEFLNKTRWHKLSPDNKSKFIQRSIERLIGPDPVLRAQGVAGGLPEMTDQILTVVNGQTTENSTVKNALEEMQIAIFLTDEFLRY